MDRYYRDLSHLPPDERNATDFDSPQAIEIELLAEHLVALVAGRSVRTPNYDFATHTRVGPGTLMEPAPVLLVEGLFCLAHERLRQQLDWSVFVETPDRTCLERRVARDVADRGRTAEQVREQYARQVRPAAERLVLPSLRYARRIVSGTMLPAWLCDTVLGDLEALAIERRESESPRHAAFATMTGY